MHLATGMAHRTVPGMLPAELVWPFDCVKRCKDMVPVARGEAVAEELTRNLREPHRSAVRSTFSADSNV